MAFVKEFPMAPLPRRKVALCHCVKREELIQHNNVLNKLVAYTKRQSMKGLTHQTKFT
jgi:hypothetical protein